MKDQPRKASLQNNDIHRWVCYCHTMLLDLERVDQTFLLSFCFLPSAYASLVFSDGFDTANHGRHLYDASSCGRGTSARCCRSPVGVLLLQPLPP